MDAEKQYPEVNSRKHSVSDRQQTAAVGPSRDTAFRSHPQSVREKELPVLPRDATQYPVQDYDIERLDLDHSENMDTKPGRRGTLSKLDRLTGASNPPTSSVQAGNDIRTERVMVSKIPVFPIFG